MTSGLVCSGFGFAFDSGCIGFSCSGLLFSGFSEFSFGLSGFLFVYSGLIFGFNVGYWFSEIGFELTYWGFKLGYGFDRASGFGIVFGSTIGSWLFIFGFSALGSTTGSRGFLLIC